MDARFAIIRLDHYLTHLEKKELLEVDKVHYFSVLLRKSG